MKVYSITHKPIKNLERLGLIPVGVGLNQFPKNYIIDNTENKIELVFCICYALFFCSSKYKFNSILVKKHFIVYNKYEFIVWRNSFFFRVETFAFYSFNSHLI